MTIIKGMYTVEDIGSLKVSFLLLQRFAVDSGRYLPEDHIRLPNARNVKVGIGSNDLRRHCHVNASLQITQTVFDQVKTQCKGSRSKSIDLMVDIDGSRKYSPWSLSSMKRSCSIIFFCMMSEQLPLLIF